MSRRRPVTLKQVAEAASCSTAVASTVLNGARGNTIASAEMAERVRAVAARLGYRPNPGAQRLRRERAHQVGVLLKNTPGDRYNDPAVFDYLLGINEGLQAADFIMSLIRYADLGRGESGLDSRVFRELFLDGMIVIGAIPEGGIERLPELMRHCLWLDTSHWDAHASLQRDELRAGALAVEALAAGAPERVHYLTTPACDELGRAQTHFSQRDRRRGVEAAAKQHKLPLSVETVPWGAAPNASALAPGTAVLAYNIPLARRFIQECARCGRTVGAVLPLACCDSSLELEASWPELARCSFDRYALGREAANRLIGLIEGRPAAPSLKQEPSWIPGATAPRARLP